MAAFDAFEPNGRDGASEPIGPAQATSDTVPEMTPEPVAAPPTGKGRPSILSLFWRNPATLHKQDLSWYDPPVPVRLGRASVTEGLLDRLAGLLGEGSLRAWLVKWTYHQRTNAAATEMEEVETEAREELSSRREYADSQRDELDATIRSLRADRQKGYDDLRAAHTDFAGAAANAGLTLSAENVTPGRVQAALLDIAPGLTEIAGEQGVSPVEDHHWTAGGILKAFFIFLAPWTAGFMLALCLGTLVGLLDLSVLRQPDQNRWQIVLAALLGFVIVYLMGEVVSAAVGTLSRGQETAASPETPRFRSGGLVAGLLLAIALMLVTAEITAETFGIRQLHQQHIMALQRSAAARADGSVAGTDQDEGGKLLPVFVYALMGLLISGPYIAYKSSRAWGDSETRMREAWLVRHQRSWVDRKWASPDVQQSFRLAHEIQRLELEVKSLETRLKEAHSERDALQQADVSEETKARRTAARAAAVGEAARLHQMVETLVEEGAEEGSVGAAPPVRVAAVEPIAPRTPPAPFAESPEPR